jgi:L-aspartate oxidase
MKTNESDVLIAGCGIAGLTAAVKAAESGLSVTVLTKAEDLHEANTYYAQGGIVGRGPGDSPELLAKDILDAGSRLNYRKTVDYVSLRGPELLEEFLCGESGIKFQKDAGGEYELTQEAAHSVRRIYHDRDRTGRMIELGLLERAGKISNISFLSGYMAVDVITNSHHSTDPQERYRNKRAIGLYALNTETGEMTAFFSGAVILATGGLGQIYQHTTNPKVATGDGIAMAYRAGASVINAEFVQFHPTTLFHRDVENFLISESVRGEGARLINRQGRPFMKDYHPMGDLAPRDEVSISIYREMERTNSRYVLLDATGLKNIDPSARFPAIFEKCMSVGLDLRKEPVPVVPAAHYFCGGVKVSVEGRTEIDGLYCVGETACTGVHGANRLASVSLLEGLVFGYHLAEQLPRYIKKPGRKLIQSIPDWRFPDRIEEVDPALIKNDLNTIQSLMWNYTGIIRTRKRLSRALSDLNYMSHRIERFYRQAALSRQLIELRNCVLVSNLITRAARINRQSIGCHYLRNGQ